jgi:uncharacterized protein (TIGR02246 family)
MRRKSLLPISILSAAMFALSGCPAERQPDREAVSAAVDTIWQEYAATLNAGDIDAWVELWTDDGVQMPPGEPPVVGKERIRARNQAVSDRFVFDMRSIDNQELRVAGDWAYARGTYAASLTPRQGGEPIDIDGKYMSILRRQPDGSWKIHRDIFNSNVPPGGN